MFFGVALPDALSWQILPLDPDEDAPCFEVHVAPPQPKQLALTHASRRGQVEQPRQPVPLGGVLEGGDSIG